MKNLVLIISLTLLLSACSTTPQPGPDKRAAGMVVGAAVGAGAGAVTGAEVASITGPGALVGAGLGAIAGGIRGLAQDAIEEDLIAISSKLSHETDLARVHDIILSHYERRLELHPSRDIYPADLFFDADKVELMPESVLLAKQIAKLNLYRFPWSRFVIASYVQSADVNSEYAKHLASNRAEALNNIFVESGMNPRRIVSRAIIVPAPILLDPFDRSDRYSQAIEFIPLDK